MTTENTLCRVVIKYRVLAHFYHYSDSFKCLWYKCSYESKCTRLSEMFDKDLNPSRFIFTKLKLYSNYFFINQSYWLKSLSSRSYPIDNLNASVVLFGVSISFNRPLTPSRIPLLKTLEQFHFFNCRHSTSEDALL